MTSLTEHQESIKDAFAAAHLEWGEAWETVLQVDPDFVAAYVAMYAVPWTKNTLSPKFKALCYLSWNAAATHMRLFTKQGVALV